MTTRLAVITVALVTIVVPVAWTLVAHAGGVW